MKITCRAWRPGQSDFGDRTYCREGAIELVGPAGEFLGFLSRSLLRDVTEWIDGKREYTQGKPVLWSLDAPVEGE